MPERDDFGPALKKKREEGGISLQEIAEKTKISASFFAALERNDFSRWPSGIFRRSFMRSYAESIGVDPATTLSRFLELFPVEGDCRATVAAVAAVTATVAPEAGKKRALQARAVEAVEAGREDKRRVRTAVIDIGAAGAVGLAAVLSFGWFALWPALAASATLILVAGNVRLDS